MRCPSCDAEVRDPEAVFCARCGAALAEGRGATTGPIAGDEANARPHEGSRGGGGTQEIEAPPEDDKAPERERWRLAALVSELTTVLRRAVLRGGWLDALTGAVVAFLAALCVGAVLLLTAKLQFPDLGAGANPLSIFSAIVITTLGSMGASVRIGDLEVHALPLGALAAIGIAIAWAASAVVARREAVGLRAKALEGARLAIPFAAVCWLASLVFRIRGDVDPISVSAFEALVLGALWGAIFGTLGGLRSAAPLGRLFRAGMAKLAERRGAAHDGIAAAIVMLVVVAFLTTAGALVWAIVALGRGDLDPDFSAADAVATIVYGAAFLPNILVALLVLALGGGVTVGARITVGGDVIGPLHSYSLLDWAGEPTPSFLFVLVVVPAVACLLGGFAARRRTRNPSAMVETLGVAAGVFAAVVLAFAAAGTARLGAGVVHRRGFAVVAPEAGTAFLLALLWVVVVGLAGWKLADRRAQS